ncbi:hypothetical protein JG688_00003368 [Phytophthora aleatoria]|uniref:Uncharacterized protein n=1 Tax=Phytophthora aleatoria TaxID=2496075 RepID=A0A8J5M813_9STRA|nr:hypothetical protein JG688_00003368 [Phytophthora aleatoria]
MSLLIGIVGSEDRFLESDRAKKARFGRQLCPEISTESELPGQTTQEKVDAIRSVIFMLPEHSNLDGKLLKASEIHSYAYGTNPGATNKPKILRHR